MAVLVRLRRRRSIVAPVVANAPQVIPMTVQVSMLFTPRIVRSCPHDDTSHHVSPTRLNPAESGARTERPPAMTLETGRQLGSYEIAAPLGAGGMGEVCCAGDPKLGHDGDLPPSTVLLLLVREPRNPQAKDGQRQEQMEGTVLVLISR